MQFYQNYLCIEDDHYRSKCLAETFIGCALAARFCAANDLIESGEGFSLIALRCGVSRQRNLSSAVGKMLIINPWRQSLLEGGKGRQEHREMRETF